MQGSVMRTSACRARSPSASASMSGACCAAGVAGAAAHSAAQALP